jgi:hypothetical protein
MKKIIKAKKHTLHIQQETIRTLQSTDLGDINGGLRPIRPVSAASNADVCCA